MHLRWELGKDCKMQLNSCDLLEIEYFYIVSCQKSKKKIRLVLFIF